jgi:hypothetical protein
MVSPNSPGEAPRLADYSQVDSPGSRYKSVNFWAVWGTSRSVTDYSQVDSPGLRYKSVNFRVVQIRQLLRHLEVGLAVQANALRLVMVYGLRFRGEGVHGVGMQRLGIQGVRVWVSGFRGEGCRGLGLQGFRV